MPSKKVNQNSLIEQAFAAFDEDVKNFIGDNTKRLKDVTLPPVPQKRQSRLLVQPQMPPDLRQ